MHRKNSIAARWLRDVDAIPVRDTASVSLVRERVREVGASQGLSPEASAALATAASELGHNQLRHARAGSVAVHAVDRLGVRGVEVMAADAGAGIADPTRALAGGASDKGGLGIGLAGAASLADEIDFDIRLGEGTCVWVRKFTAPPAKRRQIAVLAQPLAGEPVSGDDAVFVRGADGSLLLAVVDGLGHGPEARLAAAAAVETVLAQPDRSLDAILLAAHDALARTRGAAMSVTRIGPAGSVECASVGNVTTQIVSRSEPCRFGGQSWVLGQAARRGAVPVERRAMGARDMLVSFSDGASSRLGLDADLDLLVEPPLVVAATLIARHGKTHDDVLVAVIR